MKIKNIILPICLFCFSGLFAETVEYQPPFGWSSPKIQSMGGAPVIDVQGFSALFTNPAGFSTEEFDLTLLAIGLDMITDPFLLMDAALDREFVSEIPQFAAKTITQSGLGAAANSAAGWSGKNLGVGLFISNELYFNQTDFVWTTKGKYISDISIVFGYGHSFYFMKDQITLKLGADLRPAYRAMIPLGLEQMMILMGQSDGSVDLLTLPALAGLAIGFDAGAVLEYGPFSLGLSLRDIGHTRYNLYETSLDEAIIVAGPGAAKGPSQYVAPMTIAAGFSWEPELGELSQWLEQRLDITYKTPFLFGIDANDYLGYTHVTPLICTHIGWQGKFFSTLYLRAGLNSGYLTAGTGVDFQIGEFNLALYSEETGVRAGQKQQMGATAELRFQLPNLQLFKSSDPQE